MGNAYRPAIILMADDDDDDYLVTRNAFQELPSPNRFFRVDNGEELMDYLFRRGQYSNSKNFPIPDIILLDVNMPKKNGHEALKEIRAHPDLQMIPVVILSVSHDKEVIGRSYRLGANSFIKKPISYDQLMVIVKALSHYWFDIVTLPATNSIRKGNHFLEAVE